MQVARQQHTSRATRYVYHKPTHGRFGGQAFEGRIDDISATGAAVTVGGGTTVSDNGLFVDMHVEGLGHVKGNIARTYEDGFAVQFDDQEMDLDAVAERLKAMNKLI